MMKNKSNAEKTRKLGNLILLTGSGVINYNPCDHWMSPLFLKCSTDSIYQQIWQRAGSVQGHKYGWVLQKPKSPTRADTCPQAREQTGERGTAEPTRRERSTLWMQLPPSPLGAHPMLNNATPSEAGWQVLGGSWESRITSEGMSRKPGLERGVQWGQRKRPSCCKRWEERRAGVGMPAKEHGAAASQKRPKEPKQQEKICNATGCSSYQSFEGTGGKAKENKNNPQNIPGRWLLHILLLMSGHMRSLSSRTGVGSRGVSIISFLFLLSRDKKPDPILPSRKDQVPCLLW